MLCLNAAAHACQSPMRPKLRSGRILFDALAFGPKSFQSPYPAGIAEALAELGGEGEDCLTLNIWTPDVGACGRPVMLWIPVDLVARADTVIE